MAKSDNPTTWQIAGQTSTGRLLLLTDGDISDGMCRGRILYDGELSGELNLHSSYAFVRWQDYTGSQDVLPKLLANAHAQFDNDTIAVNATGKKAR